MSAFANSRLYKYRFLSYALKKLNTYPVTSQNQNAKSFKLFTDLLSQGQLVLIFPEGGRSRTGVLRPLKKGIAQLALITNCPIVPIYIQGAFEIWPPQKLFPKLSGKITITFGMPIYPDSIKANSIKESRNLLTNRLEEALTEMSLH